MATIPKAFAIAQRHHRAGRLDEANRIYREILARDPTHAGCLHLLGVIAHQSGRSDMAIHLIGRALARDPGLAEAHVNLANALKDQGMLEPAIAHYQQALALKPRDAEAHYCIGVAFQLQGQLDEAAMHYERALAIRPDNAAAQLNLGTIRTDQGEFEQAVTHFEQALTLRPDYLAAQMNLGIALSRQGNLEAAVASFERAATIAPGDPQVHMSLGTLLAELGRFGEAVTHLERALALRPGFAAAHLNLGSALREQGRLEEAAAQFQQALDHDPALAEAHYSLGVLLQQQGRWSEAVAQHERALALQPDFAPAKFALCVAELPILYAKESEIPERRAAYRERLHQLSARVDQQGGIPRLAAAVGSNQPFYLAYQQQNDREPQALYGNVVCDIMCKSRPAPALSAPRGEGAVRVGFVSGFFCLHPVWKINIKGWISQLDRRKFQVLGYHTGTVQDPETAVAAGLCHRLVCGPLPAERWREVILADAPQILIYPEVGMDPTAAWLAAQRLAATQCVTWGHPETSGFPTLDYYLSSAAMEPPNAQDHYTEQLIRLPNLSVYYEPLDVEPLPIDRSEFGLRSAATVFWCGQSLYKYLPQYDCVFPRIAREVGDCQFVFIRFLYGDYVTDLFRSRLDRAFSDFGLAAADYCVFLPRLDQQRFLSAVGLCDIFLDSIGWSGCTTTLESLIHDLPIVTFPGSLMRGRHTMAMLEMMGMTDTIAATVDEYVSMAAHLARDSAWRMEVKKRIAGAKHCLYRDNACIAALEEFLLGVTGAESRKPSHPGLSPRSLV